MFNVFIVMLAEMYIFLYLSSIYLYYKYSLINLVFLSVGIKKGNTIDHNKTSPSFLNAIEKNQKGLTFYNATK